jgi:hypothetical protein
VAGAAGAIRRIAVRRSYHLGSERFGSPDRVVEVVDLEPQRDTVAVWRGRGITDRAVVVLDVEPVQLHHERAIVDQALVTTTVGVSSGTRRHSFTRAPARI